MFPLESKNLCRRRLVARVALVASQHWLRRFGRRSVSLVLQAMLALGLIAAFVQGAASFSEPLNRWFFPFPAAVDVAAEAEEPG